MQFYRLTKIYLKNTLKTVFLTIQNKDKQIILFVKDSGISIIKNVDNINNISIALCK